MMRWQTRRLDSPCSMRDSRSVGWISPAPFQNSPILVHANNSNMHYALGPVHKNNSPHNQRQETSGLPTDYNFSDDAKEWTPQLGYFVHSLSSPSHPPPLLPRRPIPLPALTSGPVALHPLLAHQWHHGSVSPILYDLSFPPATAMLAPALRNRFTRSEISWMVQPAVTPYAAASMTLRVPALSRDLVIVFPARLEDLIVTIADVLRSVHEAFLLETGERCSGSTFLAEESGTAVRGCLGGPVWWVGLQPSSIERDVWILRVTKGRRLP